MYTEGEWKQHDNRIKVLGRGTIAICPSPTDNEGVFEFIANAERIVACVNGCKGLNPEGIAELKQACEWVAEDLERDGLVRVSTKTAIWKALSKVKEE